MATPETRLSLIARLADCEDAEAWEMFHAIYEPLLKRLLAQWGLQDADASEVVQETVVAVAKSVDRFRGDEDRGSFRGWIAGIARHKMSDLLNAHRRFPTSRGGSDFQAWLNEQPDPSVSHSRWEMEHRRAVFAWAAARVRGQVHPRTWMAFHLSTVEGVAAAQVAQRLGADVGWVYVARSRVLARLRQTVSMSGEVEPDSLESL